MSFSSPLLLAGRLALDFANLPSLPASSPAESLSWEELVGFLRATQVVSADRATELLHLTDSDPQSAFDLLSHAERLRNSLREALRGLTHRTRIPREHVQTINSILRVTEGHDELIEAVRGWRLEYVARESGLDWLLAVIARSAAELMVEGEDTRVRLCANPGCSLFFYDNSRTHRRRWCSMALCGNRSKVAAFARRHKSHRRNT